MNSIFRSTQSVSQTRLRRFSLAALSFSMVIVAGSLSHAADQAVLRIGLVGLDTSHATAFTASLNAQPPLPGMENVKVVAGYPGGSADLPDSIDRVPEYTKVLRESGVKIVDTIEQLTSEVDAIILTSVDGRIHLEQAREVFKAGKPVFIDKPLAASYADGVEIFRLAAEANVPTFTCSTLRFCKGVDDVVANPALGELVGCETYSPAPTHPTHPTLFWYGIHGVETLFTVMGAGCESVSCVRTDGVDVVTGIWKDGRVGTFRGIRKGQANYGLTAFGTAGILNPKIEISYNPMLVEIVKFFRTGEPPVSAQESLEILAFMEAADASHAQGGALVKMQTAK